MKIGIYRSILMIHHLQKSTKLIRKIRREDDEKWSCVMLSLECTKKLRDELKRDIPKNQDTTPDPFYSWHSHLFFLNRKKCVIVMNSLTRYNFIMLGLKKEDFKAYDERVIAGIRENLLADGAPLEQVDAYMKACDQITWSPTSDRSIVSQMNEMIRSIEYWNSIDKCEGIEPNSAEINRKLNKFVMLKLPMYYSGETMLAELAKRM